MRSIKLVALCLVLGSGIVGAGSTTPAVAAATVAETCADLEAIAHRGFHPPGIDENSLESFKAAASRGYSIETDVWADAEGQLWIFHDKNVRGKTGVDRDIATMSTSEVEQLRYRENGSPLPTLEEAMAYWAQVPHIPVYVEVKRKPYVADVADLIRSSSRMANTWITSFTAEVDEVAPDVRRLLKSEGTAAAPDPQTVKDSGADVVALTARQLTPETVAALQAEGIAVQNRNSAQTRAWRPGIAAGVDGQLTDLPDVLQAFCPDALRKPRITGFSPSSAGRRAVVTIRGRFFTDTTQVRFGTSRAQFDLVSASRIEARVPRSSARRTFISVRTPNGTDRSDTRFVRR